MNDLLGEQPGYKERILLNPEQIFDDMLRIEMKRKREGAGGVNDQALIELLKGCCESITPDVLTANRYYLKELDPSCVFLMRAVVGNRVFTDQAMSAIRENWCRFDLPQPIFLALSEDDENFVNIMERFNFSPGDTVKIEWWAREGRLKKLMADCAPVRAKKVMSSR